MMNEDEILKKVITLLKSRTNSSSNYSIGRNCTYIDCNNNRDFNESHDEFDIDNFSSLLNINELQNWWKHLLLVLYSFVVVTSFFGNALVCRLVFKHRTVQQTMVNTFIANMATSDILMTIFNIPFSLIRVFEVNWPFGKEICATAPLVQVTSVYVSTFTMTCIALDRHQAIMNPLKPRLFGYGCVKSLIVLSMIWTFALLMSVPHAIFNRVVEQFSYRRMLRCISDYPSDAYKKWITLFTFMTQYAIPLSVTSVAYARLVTKIRSRTVVGTLTSAQAEKRMKAKRKTIMMLIVVVIVFAICWLPLNIYHLFHDFNPNARPVYRSDIFFTCHLLAMSSVCYNPFIYCWLNEQFNRGARQITNWICYPCTKHRRRRQRRMAQIKYSWKSSYLVGNKLTAQSACTEPNTTTDHTSSAHLQYADDCKIDSSSRISHENHCDFYISRINLESSF